MFGILEQALSHFLFMNNNKNDIKPWWRDGVIVFGKVTSYIAIPVITASYIGKYLDLKYNSGNKLFLISVAISFLLTTYLIVNEARIYNKKNQNKK